MSREPTFQCECGATVQQGKRGKLRTRCAECTRLRALAQQADYYAKVLAPKRKAEREQTA